jgi:hypothetical protein
MRVKRIFLTVALLIFTSVSCSGSGDFLLEERSWPEAASACDNCIPLLFDHLCILLPSEKLRKVHVLHMDMPTVSLTYGVEGEISLLLMDEKKATGGLREEGFFKRLSVSDLHHFFVSLGNPNADEQALDLSRKVMGFSGVTGYVTLTGSEASAFWIKNKDSGNQNLYVVEKGSRYAYQIAGPLTEEIVREILSNARFE